MDKPALLLLEREATIIEIARECFGQEELEIHVANSVDLAVRIAARRNVAVAVLDATMAGSAPHEIVAKLKSAHPSVRIVFMADAGMSLDRRYAPLGLVLPKPFTKERFTDTVRSALRFQSMSAGVQRMRHSSGTYPAMHLSDSPPLGITGLGAASNPGSSPPAPPPPAETKQELDTGKIERPRLPKPPIPREEPPDSEPPRSVRPPPFARVR